MKRILFSKLSIGIFLLLLAVALWCTIDWWSAYPLEAQATYIGRDSCAKCHQQELTRWTGSHHDRAMELATVENVVGNFEDQEFSRFNVTSRFFKRDGKFYVNTEGPDGEYQDFEIKYTFGIEPMQQYMVEFPDGRVQVLRVSWDTVRNQWFYVYPSDVVDERIEPESPLHWTGMAQNWNTMCAECHSTNVQKNFDLDSNTYHTTFSEIDVSCETCHGPGSLHVEIAESNSLFWDRNHGYGLANLKEASNDAEIDTCAPCHSRRSPLHANFEGGDKYLDYYQPSLLHPGLYHADGQILDEVYVYGSFLQSRMHREGVRCSDCHDPHSLKLKFEGNKLCTQCHTPGKYDAPSHHHHADGVATQCVSCHMPSETYMVIDDRRDHSIRVPRPDLSVQLGTPNACNNCHTKSEEDAQWAADAVRNWYGDTRPDDPNYAVVMADPLRLAAKDLTELRSMLRRKETPNIVKATILDRLRNTGEKEIDQVIRQFIDHENPLVRAAAIGSLSSSYVRSAVSSLANRLNDPIRSVRFAVAQRLVQEAAGLVDSKHKAALDEAIAEYQNAQEIMSDRAASHLHLGQLSVALGDKASTIESYRTAIKLEPYLSGVRSELARLLEEQGGNDSEIEQLRIQEVELMDRDAKLLVGNSEPYYKKGMLLYLLERTEEAREAFEAACEVEPGRFENWTALVLICEKQEDWKRALEVLNKMYQLRPGDPAIRGILLRIKAAGGIPEELLKGKPASD